MVNPRDMAGERKKTNKKQQTKNKNKKLLLLILAVVLSMHATLSRRRIWCVALGRLVGLVVKASASRAEGPGFESRLRPGFFRGRVIPVT